MRFPDRLHLIIILLSFSLLAIFYVVQIPAGEGVDEVAHLEYIHFVKEQRRLPVQPTETGETLTVWMGHHPPLYYVLNALLLTGHKTNQTEQVFRPNPHFVWAENDGSNGWNVMLHTGQDEFPGEGVVRALFIVRLLGVVYGLVTLFALFQAARLAFPTIIWIPFLTTAVIAFNPSFIYMSTTIHHDILQAMWFALGIWWITHYINYRSSYSALIAGFLVGVATLTKVSGIILGLGVALAIVIRAVRERSWFIFWRDGIISGGVSLLIAGWWFVRNFILYGDFLGWHAYSYVFQFNLRPEPSFRLGVQDFFRQTYRNFWGGFGFMHITFPDIARLMWMATAVVMLGWVLLFLRDRKFFKQHSTVLIIVSSLFLGILSLYLRFSTINLGAGHGRYLFPASFSIGIFLSVGVFGLVGRKLFREISFFVAAALFIYALWLPIVHVIPKYAPPKIIDSLPSSAQVVNQELSPGVRIVGYDILAKQPLVPGTGLDIDLYWQADTKEQVISDPFTLLTLETPDGEVLSRLAGWPTPGLPPANWPQDKIVATRNSLYVPDIELPSTILLMGGVEVNTSSVLIAELPTVGGATQLDPTQLPSDINVLFGHELLLRGYKISDEENQPDETVVVTLFWEVKTSPVANHTLFIHLLDSSGQLVTQLDRLMGNSMYPTSQWQAGEAWRDSYPLMLPADLPNGVYTLHIGMYDWPSLERLPISESINDVWNIGGISVVTNE